MLAAARFSWSLLFRCSEFRDQNQFSGFCESELHGYGRFSKADQKRFFIIAMGSLRESQAVLDLTPSCPVQCLELADKLAAHIYKLIRAMG